MVRASFQVVAGGSEGLFEALQTVPQQGAHAGASQARGNAQTRRADVPLQTSVLPG